VRKGLRRRRDQVIRHANNEKFERQERELLQDAERRKEEICKDFDLGKSLLEPRPGVRSRQPQTELAIELEKLDAEMNKRLAAVDAKANQKLAELQKAKDDPFDEAKILDQWIDAVERIDGELAMVEQNIRLSLKQLDDYRTGLGQRLRQVADEIVDVEFAEESAPARQEAVGRAESGPMIASSVDEFPSPAQANGAPIQLDGRDGCGPAPSSGPAE
jgi:hypothetical protein